ncbi:hypothetical protein K469DRAFT_686929 [Zopfia rhizophila CBS 207.26]|uniref:C2H2-type domain-containing protein n=1 Tax=Zopfia rhizophila CBS 207.26 TaxID=1314779 RepID=A0A6A6E400_9PEZI|nr:hypothetical protein K469DRAFT_686929 [Zopfia rhizophila CBS 207.26]
MPNTTQQEFHGIRQSFERPPLSDAEKLEFLDGLPMLEELMIEEVDGNFMSDDDPAIPTGPQFSPDVLSPESITTFNEYASNAIHSHQISPEEYLSSSSPSSSLLTLFTGEYHSGQPNITTLGFPTRISGAPKRSVSLDDNRSQSNHQHAAGWSPSAFEQGIPQIEQVMQQPPQRVSTWPMTYPNPETPVQEPIQREAGSPSDDVYRCDYPDCDATFAKGNGTVNLVRHKRSVHGKRIPCDFCPKPFKRSDAKLKHMRKKHLDELLRSGRH